MKKDPTPRVTVSGQLLFFGISDDFIGDIHGMDGKDVERACFANICQPLPVCVLFESILDYQCLMYHLKSEIVYKHMACGIFTHPQIQRCFHT